MALIIEAPNEIYSIENFNNISLFLAGSITDCPDWQSEVIHEIKDIENLSVYNPRRKNFPINDPNAAEKQITWEYLHLSTADIISFWFDKNSLGPICLYELGFHANSKDDINIIIGIDPEYKRRQDVEIQTKLIKPKTKFVYSIDDLITEIKDLMYIKNFNKQ